MKKKITKTNYWVILGLILALGLFLRLYHIEFGLPHSFHADEPEISELAIKYTYEIRSIIKEGEYYRLIPISFVYGTFPTYLLALLTMLFSKINNLLGIIFNKTSIFIYLRVINSAISLVVIPAIAFLYHKLFKDNKGALVAGLLAALNWKLIVHAHYVNADNVLMVLLALSYITIYLYYNKKSDTLYTILSGVLFGLAIGTKVTGVIALPFFCYLFIKKKDFRGLAAFSFVFFGVFMITNPFSILFANNFAFRIYTMLTKEAGMVFDSVDSNPLKYLFALGNMITLPFLLVSLYGIFDSKPTKQQKPYHLFLLGNLVMYLVFYSLQSRRVDRWLLPILPIVLVYSARGVILLIKQRKKVLRLASYLLIILGLGFYLYHTNLLLNQYKRHTPKSEAYLWMRDNISKESNKLVYTEEGLDPMNKLLGARVIKYQVYTSENAQFFLPENPDGYDFVVLSSRPMQNFKKPEVAQKYPFYTKRWQQFEDNILKSGKFELIKEFTLPKPNLVELSDVFIYKNLTTPNNQLPTSNP